MCTEPIARPVIDSDLKIEQLWIRCEGLSLGSPGLIIHNGLLIAADFYTDAITGYDLLSGEHRWSVYTSGVFALTLDVPRERIYTYTIYGDLREMYSIDGNSGNVVWYKDTRIAKDMKRSCRPILLASGELVAHCLGDQSSYSVDVETGEFENTVNLASLSVFNDGHAWILDHGYLTAIDAITGKVFWQSAQTIGDGCCIWDVQVNDDMVLAKYRSHLTVFDKETRELRWMRPDIEVVGLPALTQNRIYVLDARATLHLLNVNDGSSDATIHFAPPKPGQDGCCSGDSIGSSQVAADGDWVAISFGDTDVLSVYRVELPQ